MATRLTVTTEGRSEHRFFFIMACAMAFVLVSGFSTSIVLHRSSFAVPILFHLHAFTFFGWIALYLLQTGLAASGSIALHRRLGWLALAWVPAMVGLGTALTIVDIRRHGAPFFFDTNEFLIGNPFGITTFAGLVLTAVAMRRRTQWHRRLMLCAMAAITGPGWGRLLPMPLLIPWAWWISAFVFPSLFVTAGMIADRRSAGRIHPAYWCGLGAMFAGLLVADLVAYSPAGMAITRAAVAGTPGAMRPMRAQFPPQTRP